MKKIQLDENYNRKFFIELKKIQFDFLEYNTLTDLVSAISKTVKEIYVPMTGTELFGKFSEVISEIENESFDIYFTFYSDKELSDKVIKYKITYNYYIMTKNGKNKYMITKIRFHEVLF